MMWGDEVQGLLDDAKLLVQQAASQHGPGLVSILIEGAPNSGRTIISFSFYNFYFRNNFIMRIVVLVIVLTFEYRLLHKKWAGILKSNRSICAIYKIQC